MTRLKDLFFNNTDMLRIFPTNPVLIVLKLTYVFFDSVKYCPVWSLQLQGLITYD